MHWIKISDTIYYDVFKIPPTIRDYASLKVLVSVEDMQRFITYAANGNTSVIMI